MTDHRKHSEESYRIHAQLSSAPCPVEGGCGGSCKTVHPRGIVLLPSGGWKPVPPAEPFIAAMREGTPEIG